VIRLEMPLFYHVQRRGPSLRVGKSYKFGSEPNFFSRDLFSHSPSQHVRGIGEMSLGDIVKDWIDPNGFRHYRNIKVTNYTADEKGLLTLASATLNHQAVLLRELVFESVRQESFTDKPSRLCGVWLIPHDEELLADWCATVPSQFKAFEIETEGRLHFGASRYLKASCVSGDVLRDHARRYWTDPVDPKKEQVEILCVGEIRIIREMKIAGNPSEGAWARFRRLL
jgi:hypothetical protein